MVKKTSHEPQQCSKCGSNDIGLFNAEYKKDKNGKKTDIPYLGMWLCNECGNTVGRMICEGCNELYEEDV